MSSLAQVSHLEAKLSEAAAQVQQLAGEAAHRAAQVDTGVQAGSENVAGEWDTRPSHTDEAQAGGVWEGAQQACVNPCSGNPLRHSVGVVEGLAGGPMREADTRGWAARVAELMRCVQSLEAQLGEEQGAREEAERSCAEAERSQAEAERSRQEAERSLEAAERKVAAMQQHLEQLAGEVEALQEQYRREAERANAAERATEGQLNGPPGAAAGRAVGTPHSGAMATPACAPRTKSAWAEALGLSDEEEEEAGAGDCQGRPRDQQPSSSSGHETGAGAVVVGLRAAARLDAAVQTDGVAAAPPAHDGASSLNWSAPVVESRRGLMALSLCAVPAGCWLYPSIMHFT